MPVSPPNLQPFPIPASSSSKLAPPAIEFTKPAGSEVRPVTGTQSQPQTNFDVDVHEVRAGDSYETISKDFFNDARYATALSEFNSRKQLKAGDSIDIPPIHILKQKYPQHFNAAPAKTTVNRQGSSNAIETTPPIPISNDSTPVFRQATQKRFTVPASGMTMRQIAQQTLGDSNRWQEIFDLNPQFSPDDVRGGAEVKLPANATAR